MVLKLSDMIGKMKKCILKISIRKIKILFLRNVSFHTQLLLSLFYLMASGLSACHEPQANSKTAEVVFRLALQPNESRPTFQISKLVKSELEARSNGRIKVLLYSSGTLGSEQQLLETCYLGIIEMVQVTTSVVTTINPMFDVLDMPYLFVDELHHRRVLDSEIGIELLDGLQQYNMYGLSFYSCGFRNIYADKPVKFPADLKGMKIRVMESPVMIESLNRMGASSTSLSASEIFSALKTGVVDGAENNAIVFLLDGHIEAVKYYSLTGHFSSQHVLVANKKWIEKVKLEHPDLYELIKAVPKDIIDQFNEIWDKSEEAAFRNIKAQGGVITEVPLESKLEFIKKVESVYEHKSKTVPPELVKRIRREAGL